MVVLPSENRVKHWSRLSRTAARLFRPYGSRLAARARPLGRALVAGFLLSGCDRPDKPVVVVYAAQDQVHAQSILDRFGRENGIEVRALYDSEAVKTVGLANRLLAEKAHPQCDVFWGNEELRTRQLARRGLWSSNGWARFGYRSRRLVINTNLLAVSEAPARLQDLTNAHWRGKVALAYPLLGTTATHFLALRQHWGVGPWQSWCRALVSNAPKIVDGNSVVVQLVGRGEATIGLTDSDDIAAGRRNGFPLAELVLTDEMLLIPNTVALLESAPHPEAARKLYQYLQQPAVGAVLVAAGALEGSAARTDLMATLQVDWERVLAELDQATQELQTIFLR
jgi:iron(III) transport system substrate-binding protein